jgi:hypothetical protein
MYQKGRSTQSRVNADRYRERVNPRMSTASGAVATIAAATTVIQPPGRTG